MNKFKITTKQLADMFHVEYIEAAGLLRFLEKRGLVTVVGKLPNISGRGKPSTIYEVPEKVEFFLKAEPQVVLDTPVAVEPTPVVPEPVKEPALTPEPAVAVAA